MNTNPTAVERYVASGGGPPVAMERREKRTPEELVAEGRQQANALMRVVRDANLARNLGGSKDHLEVEAWQTIGRFNGFLTDIVWTRPVIESGEKVGYEARAELVDINTGQHLIGAEACCFFDEEIEKKDGTTFRRWDDDYAVRSMAQTRAQSKVGRMAFAWVAVLAGYSGTPAEEMDGVKGRGGRPVVFPFGKHKDRPPTELSVEDLHKELAFWEKKTADEQNPRFKANNERLVNAIKEAIGEKTAKPESPAAPENGKVKGAAVAPEPTVEHPPASPAGDTPSPIDALWVKVKELCESKGLKSDYPVAWARKTYKAGWRELSEEQVQVLIMHLQTS